MSKIKVSFPKLRNPIKMWKETPIEGKIWIAIIIALFSVLILIDVI